MAWQPELDELRRRQAPAREMGGEERVARQRAQGKLTVRESASTACSTTDPAARAL